MKRFDCTIFVTDLLSLLVAAAIKDLRNSVLPIMASMVRHYTLVAIAQQAGAFSAMEKQNKLSGIDPQVRQPTVSIKLEK